jgi:hypothetical protein
VVNLLEELETQHHLEPETAPWLLVASFVNPHDIAIFGLLSGSIPGFNSKWTAPSRIFHRRPKKPSALWQLLQPENACWVMNCPFAALYRMVCGNFLFGFGQIIDTMDAKKGDKSNNPC